MDKVTRLPRAISLGLSLLSVTQKEKGQQMNSSAFSIATMLTDLVEH